MNKTNHKRYLKIQKEKLQQKMSGGSIYTKQWMISRNATKNDLGLFQTSICYFPLNTFPQTILCTVYGKTHETCMENARKIADGMNLVEAFNSIIK